jgi:hypothetical protein
MGKAQINYHMGEGQYMAKLLLERESYDAEIQNIDDKVAAWNERISYLRLVVDDEDLKPYDKHLNTPELRQAEITRLELKIASVETHKQWLIDNVVVEANLPVFCADATFDLTPGTIVGTIELVRQVMTGGIVIRPGYNGNAVYNTARDGITKNVGAGSASGDFYNYAILPGAQKWKPTTYVGYITQRNGDFCNVLLLDLPGVHVESEGRFLDTVRDDKENTPVYCRIIYMDCHGDAFDVGDQVVVEMDYTATDPFVYNAGTQYPRVIGFYSNPTPCAREEYFAIMFYFGKESGPPVNSAEMYEQRFFRLNVDGSFEWTTAASISSIVNVSTCWDVTNQRTYVPPQETTSDGSFFNPGCSSGYLCSYSGGIDSAFGIWGSFSNGLVAQGWTNIEPSEYSKITNINGIDIYIYKSRTTIGISTSIEGDEVITDRLRKVFMRSSPYEEYYPGQFNGYIDWWTRVPTYIQAYYPYTPGCDPATDPYCYMICLSNICNQLELLPGIPKYGGTIQWNSNFYDTKPAYPTIENLMSYLPTNQSDAILDIHRHYPKTGPLLWTALPGDFPDYPDNSPPYWPVGTAELIYIHKCWLGHYELIDGAEFPEYVRIRSVNFQCSYQTDFEFSGIRIPTPPEGNPSPWWDQADCRWFWCPTVDDTSDANAAGVNYTGPADDILSGSYQWYNVLAETILDDGIDQIFYRMSGTTINLTINFTDQNQAKRVQWAINGNTGAIISKTERNGHSTFSAANGDLELTNQGRSPRPVQWNNTTFNSFLSAERSVYYAGGVDGVWQTDEFYLVKK